MIYYSNVALIIRLNSIYKVLYPEKLRDREANHKYCMFTSQCFFKLWLSWKVFLHVGH